MCGIVGFIGRKPAAPLLLEGLAKLEYRGYDSAGIALVSEAGIEIHKAKGRLQILSDMIGGGEGMEAAVGIGHTRGPRTASPAMKIPIPTAAPAAASRWYITGSSKTTPR